MSLKGQRVAVLAENGYQELEFWYPVMRLREEGAEVVIAAPQTDKPYESQLGYPLLAQSAIADLDPDSVDAVIIPGGAAGERLSAYDETLRLLQSASARGAVTAAICTGVSALTASGVAKGHRVTGDGSVREAATDAGSTYLDQEVVVDGGLITSRQPDDLPAFFAAIQTALSDNQEKK